MEEPKYRTCKQCGEVRPIDQYRPYYNKRKGRYRTCKICEKINQRHKYLSSKEVLSDKEQDELRKIDKLYEMLRIEGLKPPEKKVPDAGILDDVDAMLQRRQAKIEARIQANPDIPLDTPAELLEWLNKDLTPYEPDDLQDDIMEDLQARYRPELGIDPATLQPTFDDQYRDVLNMIQKRVDDYEKDYYEKEDN